MIELLDWTVALVPVLAMVALFVWLDVFKLMSLSEIVVLLLAGGVIALIAYPISGQLIDVLPIGFSGYSRFVAPWIEESLKALVVLTLFYLNRIGYKLDAVISGFSIGAGFSVVENILYLMRFDDLAPTVWMVRGLGTALMHGVTGATMAAIAHELAECQNRRAAAHYTFNPLWIIPGLLVAGLVHTLFNQFPDQPLIAMMGALVATPLLLMAIFHVGSNEARGWLIEESANHRAALDALERGELPDDASGRQIAQLLRRSTPIEADHIRDYLLASMRLVVTAEEKLLGHPVPPDNVLLDTFERMESAQRAIGKAGFAALEPLLPYSRNDLWELRELREDLRKPA
ncbi:PrsW family intramembrane metalloprotease [Sphingomonas rhizophila]|uniref:PrsW family intramembrane metalloprotease n=1 Tax=Sphingomonas rhizophila TaxID=2071607 RepID=A0A7G9SBW9_9SPHN|nr:PrsW family glutamic-type intramembrane protease [Sphingomonas rhizophila]QNN65344.1 PrsW family intramembrane metalloprotease [Sphingomonas rhizophila]